MNILILNWRDREHPEAGGAEVHLHSIFARLVTRGHTATILTTRFKDSATRTTLDGIEIVRWGHTYTFNWEAPFLISRLLKTRRFDVIIDDVNKIPFFTPRWFPRHTTCVIFHHLFGRTVFELTSWPLALYVLTLERLAGWGYRHVPCCTVSSSTAGELVAAGLDRSRMTIIENSVDTDRYCPQPAIPRQPDLLLYAGRLKRYKNIPLIMDAMQLLAAQGRLLRLVIAGSGDDEARLRQYAAQSPLADRVEFRGYVSEEEKIDLYRRAILFVNPSAKEGWGITSIEANACGTAVIANDAPGLRDSVRHDQTGLLFSTGSAADCARCIQSLLDDPTRRFRLQEEGRRWALSFSWDASAARIETWLARMAGTRSGAGA